MAPSFSNAKIISAFVLDGVSAIASRRGYAASAEASQSVVSSGVWGGGNNVMMRKGRGESSKTNSWIPDPVTGYYRPENRSSEIDAAELRRILLKNKN